MIILDSCWFVENAVVRIRERKIDIVQGTLRGALVTGMCHKNSEVHDLVWNLVVNR